MKFCIGLFTFMFAGAFIARFVCGYYAETQPVYEAVLTPLTWLSIIFAALMAPLVLITVVKAIKERKGDSNSVKFDIKD